MRSIKTTLFTLAVALFVLPSAVFATASSTTYTAPGSYTFTVPTGVTSITVEAWGGGGTGGPATGNGSAGGGGAGGCYAAGTYLVNAGETYGVKVAATSTALASTLVNGNSSTFATTTVVATGGAGGTIATVATSTPGVGSTSGCVATSTIGDSDSFQNSSANIGSDPTFFVQMGAGQSVTPAATFPLLSATFGLAKTGSPTDNLYVSVANSLNGTDIASSSVVVGSSLTGTLTDTSFTFSSPPTLTASTQYFVRVNRTGSLNGVDYYTIADDTTNLYAGGNFLRNTNGTWSDIGTVDLYFILHGNGTSTVAYRGGTGATSTVSTLSGGGGGGAGSTGNGGDAGSPFASSSGSGTSVGGGNGGGGTSVSATQSPGFAAGGGGAGGRASNATDRAGGNGAAGQVKISYTITTVAGATKVIFRKAKNVLRKALIYIK